MKTTFYGVSIAFLVGFSTVSVASPYLDSAVEATWQDIEGLDHVSDHVRGREYTYHVQTWPYPDDYAQAVQNLITACQGTYMHKERGWQHGENLTAQQNVPLRIAQSWPSWESREIWDFRWSWWFGDDRLVVFSKKDDSDIDHVYRKLGTHQVFTLMWQTDLVIGASYDSTKEWWKNLFSIGKQSGSGDLKPVSCNYLTVKVVPNNGPTAHATASNYGPFPGEYVTFWGGGSSDPDGNKLSYRWSFSDGVVKYGKTISRSFYNNGVKNIPMSVTLRVSDGDKADTTSLSFTVRSNQFNCGVTYECY